MTLSETLFAASSNALIVYTYLTLFFRPVSSNRLVRPPLKTADGSAPVVPGVLSISIAVVSGEAVQVNVAVPSSQSKPTFEIFGGVPSYLNAGDVPLA